MRTTSVWNFNRSAPAFPPPPLFFKEDEDGCAHGNAEKTVPFSSVGFRDFHPRIATHEGDEKGIENFSWKTRRGEITCDM
jgi:hypothetical protein